MATPSERLFNQSLRAFYQGVRDGERRVYDIRSRNASPVPSSYDHGYWYGSYKHQPVHRQPDWVAAHWTALTGDS